MEKFDNSAIGQRIKKLRKQKGLNQSELAALLGKSLRTVQKYENGDIEVSFTVVNQLAEILETTPTYLIGYESDTVSMKNLADIMGFLFRMEQVSGLKFDIDVKKPPRSREWQCSISFNGKNADADHNADMCLFLEQWEQQRKELSTCQCSQKEYRTWQEQTLSYYESTPVSYAALREMTEEERVSRRKAYLQGLCDETKKEH